MTDTEESQITVNTVDASDLASTTTNAATVENGERASLAVTAGVPVEEPPLSISDVPTAPSRKPPVETIDLTGEDSTVAEEPDVYEDEEEMVTGSGEDSEDDDSELSGNNNQDSLAADTDDESDVDEEKPDIVKPEEDKKEKPSTKPAAGPRRSRRKNFGNRYEQAISKEKEDITKPSLRKGKLLENATGEWEADEDSEEEDADFRPDQVQNGTDEDHSQSDSASSSSSDEEGGKDTKTTVTDEKPHKKKRKDPLNAIAEQKRSLDQLLDEIAVSDKLENVKVCSVCLWDEYDTEKDCVVQCDSCGVPVHEQCYGVLGKELEEAHAAGESDGESSSAEMPWFCDSCRFGEKSPQCIACPNRYGAFKQTVKGDWIHAACARYIREVYFDDDERVSDTVLADLPYNRWGNQPCIVCEDVYAKNSGVTIQCETGMCRKHLHATCAMMVGTAAELEPEMGHPLAVYCPDHCLKEDRSSNRRCFLAALGLQRKHQMALAKVSDEEKVRLDVAEKKQHESYLHHRNSRQVTDNSAQQPSARPLHSAYWLIMKGHERSLALGWDAKPIVNANPNMENVRSARPDFRPEFVAYVYKREKMIGECLERMDAAREARQDVTRSPKKFDPTLGKAAAKRYAVELKYEKESVMKLLAPFAPYMQPRPVQTKKSITRHRSSPRSDGSSSIMRIPSPIKVPEVQCKICDSGTFPQRMVQCDDCSQWFHLRCLDPPLMHMPNKKAKGVKWLCSDCAPTDEDSNPALSDQDDNNNVNDDDTISVEQLENTEEGQLTPSSAVSMVRKRRHRLQQQSIKDQARDKLEHAQAAAIAAISPVKRKRPPKANIVVKKRMKSASQEEGGAHAYGSGESGSTMTGTVGDNTNDIDASGSSDVKVVRPKKEPKNGTGRRQRWKDEDKSGQCCTCHYACDNKDAVNCDKCEQWYHFGCLKPALTKSPRSRFYGWLCEDCSSPDPELPDDDG